MRTKHLWIALSALLLAGCANTGVVSTSNNTYMVIRGGWPAMSGFACESECYQAANKFCASNHLAMASSKATVVDGAAFQHNASCKLVFVATNLATVADKP